MNKAQFAVDAALVRELGEHLVGRAHIALAELVKNAYDADAITCSTRIFGDRIEIADDGHGMSETVFLKHWMRIGTPHKAERRRSEKLGRSLAGSKGIGRLSVQFLAEEMELYSTTQEDPGSALFVVVDWRGIHRGKDLATFNVDWDVGPASRDYPDGSATGTLIILRKLKTEWTEETLRELGDELWTLRSPFERFGKRSRTAAADDFTIDLEAPKIAGAQKAFDAALTTLFGNWRARIKGGLARGRRGEPAHISLEFRPGYPDGSEVAENFSETVALPVRTGPGAPEPFVDEASFEILVFRTAGRQAGGLSIRNVRDYLAKFGNVSLYDAGFRLPYYGGSNETGGQDWLGVAVDQARRLNVSKLLPDRLQASSRYMQDLPAPGRIFGAVHVDTGHEAAAARAEGALRLQIQPGRDRLHGNAAFVQLRDLVRFSLDLYAYRYRQLSLRAAESEMPKEPPSRTIDRSLATIERNRDDIPTTVYREVREDVLGAKKAAAAAERTFEERIAALAPLATAGMTALALNHELARETRFMQAASDRLRQMAEACSLPELKDMADQFDELRGRLASIQDLFAPLLSEADSAPTERLRALPVIQQIVGSMRPLLPGVEVDFTGVPGILRFPVGSFAEWSAIIQNALANAWNATLDSSRRIVSFDSGRDRSGRDRLLISDTGGGLAMPLSASDVLFEPFERRFEISDDNRSIAIGGQGLGLTLIRMLSARIGARARFVKPLENFSTSLEISWMRGKG